MYDLIVIGGGPGGYSGAIRAAKLGMKVALIEQSFLGGTCLNYGCIPTKALLHSGETFFKSKEWAQLGIMAQNILFDQSKAYLHKQKIVETLRGGIQSLIKANKIDFYNAKGYIVDSRTIRAGNQELQTKFVLIATGSRPCGLDIKRPILGIEKTLNSDNVLDKPIDGDSIIIIGGGVIATEFASYFGYINKNVTMLISGERILKNLSKELSLQLMSVLKKNGIKIILNASIKEASDDYVVYNNGEEDIKLCADAIVSAVGRTLNTDNIGLENIGIKANGFVSVDKNMHTGVDGVYACGDVVGKTMLAHYASASAVVAVDTMLDKNSKINLDIIPSCVYTMPQIAVIGKQESQVENAVVGKFLMGANGKSLIEGINRGYIKVICDSSLRVVGAELFCINATDMIGEIALAIDRGLTASQVADVIHPHPTVAEAVAEAFEDVFKLAINKI